MSKEAMKLALEALELNNDEWKSLADSGDSGYWKAEDQDHYQQTNKAITALREALAEQPAQQEPVAWVCYGSNNKHDIDFFEDEIADLAVGTMLYTPAQRTWVGLTDGEWMNIVNKDHAWFGQRPEDVAHEVAKLVETKLKEKNT